MTTRLITEPERRLLLHLAAGENVREATLAMGLSYWQVAGMLRSLRASHHCRTTYQLLYRTGLAHGRAESQGRAA